MGGALIVWAFLILAGVAALSFVAVPKGTNQVSVRHGLSCHPSDGAS